jgi:trk system potassium uptake protein TrkA
MRIVVVGAGKVGFNVSKSLSKEKHDVIIIDKDPEALRMISEHLDVLPVVGNGASAKVLEDIGIKSVNIMLAVTENDELNLIACMTAKQFGVPMTVARVRNTDYTSPHPYMLSYSKYGIDLIINPEHLAAQEIFRLIEVPMATDMEYFFDGKLSLVGIKVEDDMAIVGKRIADLNLRKLTIVAIVRDGKALIPNGDTQLLAKDKIYVLGETKGFHNLNGLIKQKRPSFRRLMIAGASLTAQFLVRLLAEKKVVPEVTIIDTDLGRLRELAQELDSCRLIHADPTKIEVLEEEQLGPNDAFITTMGSENSNLVACTLAKKLGTKEIICEISREDYIPIAEMMGVTATITPRLLMVNTVLKLVRRSNVLSVNLLDSGDAEIIEIRAEQDAPITRDSIKNLDLPKGMVIGSIIHENQVLVPRGDTIIKPEDRVIIFALHSIVSGVERWFTRSASVTEDA